jgi:hypothetical protein
LQSRLGHDQRTVACQVNGANHAWGGGVEAGAKELLFQPLI